MLVYPAQIDRCGGEYVLVGERCHGQPTWKQRRTEIRTVGEAASVKQLDRCRSMVANFPLDPAGYARGLMVTGW